MIFDKMKELVAEQFGVDPDEITMETSFVDDLEADSIDIVELMMAAEEAFNMEAVEENALEGVKTVGDIVNYIKDRI
jgi:acyl carrier protein